MRDHSKYLGYPGIVIISMISLEVWSQTINSEAKTSLAFTHVNVIDVRKGEIKKNITVVISGHIISAVGKKKSVPKNSFIVNATAKYLIPGLWDMHAHILNRWDRAAPLYIANGVTGVRDMATSHSMQEVKQIRQNVSDGKITGPRFITPGPLLDGPSSRFPGVAILVSSKERAIKIADSLKEAGIDFYKTYDGLSREAFYTIIQKGRQYHLKVSGHIPASITREEASNAGMTSIEHIKFVAPTDTIDGNPVNFFREASWALAGKDTQSAIEKNHTGIQLAIKYFNDDNVMQEGKIYVKNNTWVTPTLVQSMKAYYPNEDLLNNKTWKYMPATIVGGWRDRILSNADIFRMDNPDFAKLQLRTIYGFHKVGVKFLAGTDANDAFIGNVPGFSVHEEMQLFVRAGLSNFEALQTATINPAIYLDASDSLGTIEEGKIADMVLLDQNPFKDIKNTKKILAVISNGKYYSRKELDKLLSEVELIVMKK